MKTICISLVTASALLLYSSNSYVSNYNAKISMTIPELSNNDLLADISKELMPISGVFEHNINTDTNTLELIVDLHLFSIDDLIDSFDLMGISSADPIIEDIFY
ncbi:hypothetical protein OAY83_00790 [Candidatus Marinimicrobia bacterium]|nr:hypothetical protein [Candidatus Neomarinimicrobiota bacterium]